MSTTKKKTKPTNLPVPKSRHADEPDHHDPDAAQVLASIARVRDPMTRYLVTMLIDRLTQGISALERGELRREGDQEPWSDPRTKPN